MTLTIDIIDNIGLPENSTEIATQNKRLSILMETKYLDESLIPSDPDRSLADQDALNNGGPGNPPVVIPWLMNDEVDEDAALIASLKQQHTVPSSSSVSTGYGNRQDLSLPHIPAHTIDYSMQIAQLPRMIQMLDPMTLQMVLDNDVVLQSLVRHDGSVNEEYLDILQNSSSLDDYLQALSFVSEPSFANFGNGWQNNNINPLSIPNNLHHQSQHPANSGLMFNNALPLSNSFNNNGLWTMNNMNNMSNNLPNGMPNSNLANILNNLNNIANNNASMSMSNMQSMNMNMNANNTSSFSIPSMGLDLSTIDGARLSKPISSKPSSLSTRATIACKFFNTARGCANGDKCPFGHFRQNTSSSAAPISNSMTATIVSNLMSDGGGSQKRGPGNTRGGRGPGQKGGRGGFRHG